MHKFHSAAITALLTGLMAGCSFFNDSSPASQPIPLPEPVTAVEPVAVEYVVLHKADYNLDDRSTVKSFLPIETEAQYRGELAKHSVEVPKPVDFTRQRVVALTMGSQPAGGYAVGVSKVEEYADKVVITVELRSPGIGCINTQAISNPYEFAQIDSVKPMEFSEVEVVQQCEPA